MMLQQVWKYQFGRTDAPQPQKMPVGAKLLHVAMQGGLITLWALVSPENTMKVRYFHVHGTGHPIKPTDTYVGTTLDLPFVWHLFEVMP